MERDQYHARVLNDLDMFLTLEYEAFHRARSLKHPLSSLGSSPIGSPNNRKFSGRLSPINYPAGYNRNDLMLQSAGSSVMSQDGLSPPSSPFSGGRSQTPHTPTSKGADLGGSVMMPPKATWAATRPPYASTENPRSRPVTPEPPKTPKSPELQNSSSFRRKQPQSPASLGVRVARHVLFVGYLRLPAPAPAPKAAPRDVRVSVAPHVLGKGYLRFAAPKPQKASAPRPPPKSSSVGARVPVAPHVLSNGYLSFAAPKPPVAAPKPTNASGVSGDAQKPCDWVATLCDLKPLPGLQTLRQAEAGDWVSVLGRLCQAPGLQTLLLAVRPPVDWIALMHALTPTQGIGMLRSAQGSGSGQQPQPELPGLALMADLGLEGHHHLCKLVHTTIAHSPGAVTRLPGLTLLGPGPGLQQLAFAAVAAASGVSFSPGGTGRSAVQASPAQVPTSVPASAPPLKRAVLDSGRKERPQNVCDAQKPCDWVATLCDLKPLPGLQTLRQAEAGDWVGVLGRLCQAPGLQTLLLAVRPPVDWIALMHALTPTQGIGMLRSAQGSGSGQQPQPELPGLALMADLGLEGHHHLCKLVHTTIAHSPGAVIRLPGLTLLGLLRMGPGLQQLAFAAVAAASGVSFSPGGTGRSAVQASPAQVPSAVSTGQGGAPAAGTVPAPRQEQSATDLCLEAAGSKVSQLPRLALLAALQLPLLALLSELGLAGCPSLAKLLCSMVPEGAEVVLSH